MTGVKAVFLDRDGVINRKMPEDDYVKCWEEFEFLPNAKKAIQLLWRAGYYIIVVTNQRGIARGTVTTQSLQQLHERLLAELANFDSGINAIYYCPHDEGKCDCRKPKTGLFQQAKRDFPEIEFTCSYVIGDSLKDLEAGTKLGCRNILIADEPNGGKLVEDAYARGISIEAVAGSLFEAVVRYVLPEG